MPEGYGVPSSADGQLAWEVVEGRLVEAIVYWLATTRPDGRPHVMPRWGVWLDGRFWYDGSPETVHARNLRTNSACVLHLEDGTAAVIVEGSSRPSEPVTGELGRRISAAMCGKYETLGYAPAPDAWSGQDAGGLSVFEPVKTLAWMDYPTDVTRFRH